MCIIASLCAPMQKIWGSNNLRTERSYQISVLLVLYRKLCYETSTLSGSKKASCTFSLPKCMDNQCSLSFCKGQETPHNSLFLIDFYTLGYLTNSSSPGDNQSCLRFTVQLDFVLIRNVNNNNNNKNTKVKKLKLLLPFCGRLSGFAEAALQKLLKTGGLGLRIMTIESNKTLLTCVRPR